MIRKLISDAMNTKKGSVNGSETAVEKVNDYIKKRIVLGSLKSGDRIPTEVELCQMLNVSRGSVREAMKILEALGIIRIVRGDGTYISEAKDIHSLESILFKVILGDAPIAALIEFREEIEFSVLRIAARNIRPEEIVALRANIEETKNHIAAPNPDGVRLYELDNAFHDLLGKATHNLMLEEVYHFAHEIIAPMILKNYELGQPGQLTVDSHELTMTALETNDFHLMGYVVKMINDIWMKSYYGQHKQNPLLDRDILNSLVMREKIKGKK